MELEQEALRFAERLEELFYVRRDMEDVLSCLDEGVSWIGTGSHELVRCRTEAADAIGRELAEYGGAFQIKTNDLAARALSPTVCLVYGRVTARPLSGEVEPLDLRVTLACERFDGGMRLLHCHLSRPDYLQAQGYYVHQNDRAENSALLLRLRDRDQLLNNLVRNIPGGVHRCKNDLNFTLLDMSDEFLHMFGYTREEIQTRFDDKFINMIYPSDRAEMYRSTYEQLKAGSNIELEYRVLCRDGSTIWILDKGRLMAGGDGVECFYCILLDITARKQAQEELRLSLERHQIIMDQAADIIFEWNIRADTLSFSPNWHKKFGYDPISAHISDGIPHSENIYPEDIPIFLQLMRSVASGVPYDEAEFRLRNIDGRYLWCRIRATTQFDDDKQPIKAVGVIVDIDTEKRQKEALLEQAQRDALTGLYNKATVNNLVERRMTSRQPDSFQALMIIDVDQFKQVNDTYGHLTGDALLSDVAMVLRGQVRGDDLVGRIGGDEFLVYLPQVRDEDAAHLKAERILAALHRLIPAKGALPITCSIGVAFFPYGSIDYFALYKCADQALYYQKNNGRAGVSFYHPALADGKMPCGLSPSAVGASIVSDDDNVADEQLAQYCFRTLYAADDLERTLNRLLEIIGRSYDVSRVYIFESSEDGSRTSITFEWCADGIVPQMEGLQNLSYQEDLGNYQSNFDERGLFYCHNIENMDPNLYKILKPQGIHSMLQCAILEGGRFWGGVGFDECRKSQDWTSDLVASFRLTASVLASFLVKLRLKEKLNRLSTPSFPKKDEP